MGDVRLSHFWQAGPLMEIVWHDTTPAVQERTTLAGSAVDAITIASPAPPGLTQEHDDIVDVANREVFARLGLGVEGMAVVSEAGRAIALLAATAEREACAQVAERPPWPQKAVAAAIRARGQKP